ncbi:SH3 domain-containing protein [Novosphingobium profundi]|uniref:SH3 domain-containing protein n=1 Tax=Novosphingobium profundi TaxID=1774954 RepID=UPI0031BA5A8B
MTNDDSYTRPFSIEGMLAMTGPSIAADPRRLPLRGDLAHIKLAGRCFVPHYAVPIAYTVKAGARLQAASSREAEVLAEPGAGEVYNVLDIAGEWAWGQLGEDGFVGYMHLGAIDAPQAGASD